VVTNIGADLIPRFAELGDKLKVKIGAQTLTMKLVRTFGDVKAGDYLCYVGSAGLLELAQNGGNLAGKLKVNVGTVIYIWR
jgi:S-adenosylmethionine hydrolase